MPWQRNTEFVTVMNPYHRFLKEKKRRPEANREKQKPTIHHTPY